MKTNIWNSKIISVMSAMESQRGSDITVKYAKTMIYAKAALIIEKMYMKITIFWKFAKWQRAANWKRNNNTSEKQ